MSEIFRFSKKFVYSLRSDIQFKKPSINTVQFGCESTVWFGVQIWELIPKNIKSLESVDIFKSKINRWVLEIFPCRLCQTYVNQIGFSNHPVGFHCCLIVFSILSWSKKRFDKNDVYICKIIVLTFIVSLLVS